MKFTSTLRLNNPSNAEEKIQGSFEIQSSNFQKSDENIILITRLRKISIIMILLTISHLATASSSLYYHYFSVIMVELGLSVLMLLYLIFLLHWISVYLDSVLSWNYIYQKPPPHRRNAFAFISSMFLMTVNLYHLVSLYVWESSLEEKLKGINESQNLWDYEVRIYDFDELTNFYRYSFIFYSRASILYLLHCAFTAVVAYRCMSNVNKGVSLFVSISNLILFWIAIALIWHSTNCEGYEIYSKLMEIYPWILVRSFLIFGILLIIFSSMATCSNYSKSRVGSLITVFFLSIILIGMVIMVGLSYRYSRYIKEEYSSPTQCLEYMQMTSEIDLKNSGCPNKYFLNQTDEFITSTCPANQIAEIWEYETNVPINQKKHQLGCLNPSCCGIQGIVFSNDFYLLSNIGFWALLFTSLVNIGTFYLWYINLIDYNLKSTNIFWLILWVLSFLSLITVLIIQTVNPTLYFKMIPKKIFPQEYGIINFPWTNFDEIKQIPASLFGENACYSLPEMNLNFDPIDCTIDHCYTYGLNANLLGINGYFRLKLGILLLSSVNLKYVDQKSVLFPSSNQTDSYFGLYGVPNDILISINNQIEFCVHDPSQQTRVFYVFSQFDGNNTQWTNGTVSTNGTSSILQEISGVLLSNSLEPISEVTVNVDRFQISTKTDDNGFFSFKCPVAENFLPLLASFTFTQSNYIPLDHTVQIGGFPLVSTKDIGQIILFSFNKRILQGSSTHLSNGEPVPSETDISLLIQAQLSFNIIDADNFNTVQNVNISFYNEQPSIFDYSNLPMISSAITDQNGSAQVSNFQRGYFMATVSSRGYNLLSQNIIITSAFLLYPLTISTQYQTSLIRFVLDCNGADLELNANFMINNNTECIIDSFNQACGFITLNYIRKRSFVIDILHFGQFDYLVYVKIYQDNLVNKRISNDGESSESKNLNIIPSSFSQLRVYVQDIQWTILTLTPPNITQPDTSNQEYIWLALCLNGGLGPISITPISEYYSITSGGNMTDSRICNEYRSRYQNLSFN